MPSLVGSEMCIRDRYMGCFVGDFEGRAAARENRGTAGAMLPGQADKAVGWPSGEAIGNILLLGRQDIDGVVAGLAKRFEVMRIVVQTPKDQGRVERNRREGIDGQADRMTIRVDSRDDGNAGGEASEGIAQGAAVVLRLGHRV
eukprot:TRINITY_DN1400_c0_g1_i16.p4 TRINITY_DN1400_c0_g1~~TRINITY_DN1400_c0_g1_i16.p4  ORF type:complete len:144 (+),score=16.48 TRINITY_DN1400_c0_g1_i16:122-553(+)